MARTVIFLTKVLHMFADLRNKICAVKCLIAGTNQGKTNVFKTRIIILTHLFFLMAAWGCVEVVTDIEFPDVPSKVVVHAFISPSDTAVQVMLTWSNPIYGGISTDSIRYISDATVKISEIGKPMFPLSFHPKKRVYFISADAFPVEAGKQYALQVDAPGMDPITATCFVPQANTTLVLESIEREITDWSEIVRVIYSFTDIPGERENFYASSAYLDSQLIVIEEDTLKTPKQQFFTASGENYISNKGREGRKFLTRAEGYQYSMHWMGSDADDEVSKTVFLLLLTTDEHYYNYHKALENYFPDNPFAEPILMYSNIEGGLGVFAGFSRYEVRVNGEW